VASHLYDELHDRVSSIEFLKRACGNELADASAALKLAEQLKYDRRLNEAFDLSSQLIEAGWGDIEKSSVDSVTRLLRVHWVGAVWLGRLREAIDASAQWQMQEELRPTLACINVSAKKRLLEQIRSSGEAEELIKDMLTTLDYVLTNDGYIGVVAHETLNALDQIAWAAERYILEPTCAAQVCQFVDCHLVAVCQVHREKSIDDPEVLRWITVFQGLECGAKRNFLLQQDWGHSLERSADPVLAEHGYIPVEVYARPKAFGATFKPFLFARDSEGAEYHVSTRAASMTVQEFDGLRIGDRLLVLPSQDSEEGKAIPVRDAIRA
jgi:hypothetical protein